MRLEIPVPWVTQGYGVPTVCVRHGRPETRRAGMDVVSQAPGWTYAMIALGWFPFWVARAVTKKTIHAKAWPFCGTCVTRRWITLAATTLVIAAGGVAALAGMANIDSGEDWAFWASVGGIALAIAGLSFTRWAQWAGVAKAVVDSEVVWVRVRSPHPEFEEQFAMATRQVQDHSWAVGVMRPDS
jgi:hypothetical protein